MSLVKQEVAPSAFIDDATAPSKVDGRTVAKKAYKQAVNRHSTIYTLWLLAVKHKTGLLVTGNIILVMNWALPEWPAMVMGLIGK
jgi:hypothetical protein